VASAANPSTPKIVLLVFCALALITGGVVGVSEALKHIETTTMTLPQHVDRIEIDADEGDIRLEAARAPDVVIIEEATWIWDRPRLHQEVRNGVLRLKAECPPARLLDRCSSDLTVRVPFDVDVKVEGDAGDIRVDGLAGHIDLSTGAGDVHGVDLHPVTAKVNTDAGDVDLAFGTQPVDVDAFSDAGDVEVEVPGGGEFRVDALTEAGDIAVENVLRNDRALRHIKAETDAGDVTVRGRN